MLHKNNNFAGIFNERNSFLNQMSFFFEMDILSSTKWGMRPSIWPFSFILEIRIAKASATVLKKDTP
jgi:hypothetical protein